MLWGDGDRQPRGDRLGEGQQDLLVVDRAGGFSGAHPEYRGAPRSVVGRTIAACEHGNAQLTNERLHLSPEVRSSAEVEDERALRPDDEIDIRQGSAQGEETLQVALGKAPVRTLGHRKARLNEDDPEGVAVHVHGSGRDERQTYKGAGA